jgi:hypothetical protein
MVGSDHKAYLYYRVGRVQSVDSSVTTQFYGLIWLLAEPPSTTSDLRVNMLVSSNVGAIPILENGDLISCYPVQALPRVLV